VLEKFLNGDALSCFQNEAVLEEVPALIGYAGRKLWRTLCISDYLHDAGCVSTILDPWRLASHHLDDAAAKGPHIARFACALPFDDFWCHPVG